MIIIPDICVLLILLVTSVTCHHKGASELIGQHHNIIKRQSGDSSIFYVITRAYPKRGRRLLVGNETSLQKSGFDPSHPTRILIHGWIGGRLSTLNRQVGEAYLRRGEYNVIVVDWSQISYTIDYVSAKRGIAVVAPKVVELVEFLNSKGNTAPDSIYLIGHSLGAHLAGAVGRRLRSPKIGVIVALDPALPLYMFDRLNWVSKSDADYVLSIHTNGGELGIYEPIGHASFYPSWGTFQPNCGFDLLGFCSHTKSIDYFAESLADSTSKFVSRRCNSFFNLIFRNCPAEGGGVVMGGDPVDRTYRGLFYVPI